MNQYLAALDTAQRGDADRAVLDDWRASTDPRAWLCAAAALAAAGSRHEARRELTRIVEHEPVRGAVLIAAAALHFEIGDFQTALACVDRVAVTSPSDAGGAVLLKFRLAMQLGWRRDAITAGEQLLVVDAQRARDVHAQLQRLLTAEENWAEAFRHWALRAALEPDSSALQWEAARLLCRLGRFDQTAACVEKALQLADATAAAELEAARLLTEACAFVDAERHARAAAQLDPTCTTVHLLRGQLRLWAGDAQAALAITAEVLARDPDCAAVHRQRGGAFVLLRRYPEALAALDRAIAADPSDAEAHSFRAEALFRLGRLEDARAALERHPSREDTCYWVRSLLLALVMLQQRRAGFGARLRTLLKEFPDLRVQPRLLVDANYELRCALVHLVPGAEAVLARSGGRRRTALLDAALGALGGNRSARPTVQRAGDGALEYVPLACPRRASVAVLGLIKTAAPQDVVRAFDCVVAQYPDSSLPVCYRGELYLWLGNYAEARADLQASIAQRATTRWAYYGLASLANVEGDPRAALATCAQSIRIMGSEAPPIYAHRGEALRRLGRTAEALRELRRACELSPARLSGRLNLALAEGDAGDMDAEAAGYDWLCAQAPGLVSDAGLELGIAEWIDASQSREERRAILERMLVMMRGNRASSFTTWIGRAGTVRIASASREGSTALDRWREGRPQREQSLRALLQDALRGA